MATASLGTTLRRVFDRVREAGGGDGELLTRYRTDRDQDAFGSLVRRHGPMVLGVCRRVLRDAHAADDAFQATFLVLARKASAVRPPDRLAPWLYGVAYRTALKARGRAFRRRQVEGDYAAARGAAASRGEPADAADLLPVIDEQLNALPEKYRDPLVMCGIQGLNKAEAANRLGLPEGTVSSRLARAREMLRDRLTRRGVAVPSAALAALLTADTLQAAVTPPLAEAAAAVALGPAPPAAVLTLSHEVIRSMTVAKLKLFGVVALSASLVGGFGLAVTADDKKPAQEKAAPQEKPREKPAAKPDGEKPARRQIKMTAKVAGVDAANRSLAVVRERDNGKVEEFMKLAADAKLFVDGKPAELKDVPKDATAALVLNAPLRDGERPEIAEARITGATVNGLLRKVGGSSVTLAGGEAADREFKTTADTKVTVNGKDAKLADLKSGDKVTVTLTAKGDSALSVSTGAKADGGEAGRPGVRKPNLTGVIGAVDAKARTLTLFWLGEGGPREGVVVLAADAVVTVDGKEGKLDGLKAVGVAEVYGAAPRRGAPIEAKELVVKSESFTAVVKEAGAGKLTLLGGPADSKTPDPVLKLDPAGKVLIDGKESKLSDLQGGDRAAITMNADRSAAVRVSVTTKRDGDRPKGEKPKGDK